MGTRKTPSQAAKSELEEVHELALERRELLAKGVKEDSQRLREIEDRIKDCVDDAGGPIPDEALGIALDYNRKVRKVWNIDRLKEVLSPDDLAEILDTVVTPQVLKEMVKAGLYTERQLRDCFDEQPIRGSIIETPLRAVPSTRRRPRSRSVRR